MTNLKRGLLCLFVLSHLVTWPLSHCVAAVPPLIHYQGRLTEANQAPLTGAHTVTIRIYDAETGSAPLWQETHSITLSSEDRGIFSVLLGSLTSFGALTFNQPLWLSIEVDGEGEMSPRQRFAAVGYAINADTLDGLRSNQFVRHGDLPASAILLLTGGPTSSADALHTHALVPHASRHQPDGIDALPTSTAVSIGSANSAGTSTSVARADHVHAGVQSLSASGPPLVGDVALMAGSNITLSQSGQAITIAAAGAGASGNRATDAASNAVTISTASDTSLLSVTITKSHAGSALLVLATVQLTHAANPNNKLVDVKLFRGATPLDAGYQVRLGTSNQAVSDLPVTLHAWDVPTSGSYTFTLKARSSAGGATATVRRLTVVELL